MARIIKQVAVFGLGKVGELVAVMLGESGFKVVGYDSAPLAARPVRWDMHRVLTISTTLGIMGVVETFILFWFVDSVLKLPREMIQTLIFLKLLVAGHLTIYLTRNPSWFWRRPWPSWILVVSGESTKVIGTLAAVYGWLMPPIGWGYAGFVWGYAIVWFVFSDVIKMAVYRIETQGPAGHATRWSRLTMHLRS